MSKVKIIYVIGQLGPGGAEKQLYGLVKGLNKDRFNPLVISLSQTSKTSDCVTKNDYMAHKIRDLSVTVIQLRRRGHLDLSRLINLIKIFRKYKPHIIHTYLSSANTYGRIAALFARIPIIIASERSSYEIGKNKTLNK